MQTRAQSLELLDAVKKTLANATSTPPQPVGSVYLSCIASTLLVIAHTLIESHE